jgi:DNA polymerase III subunit chi
MTEIHFYHLTRSNLDQLLPELLEKTLARGWRAVVLAESDEKVEALNRQLWLYRADSFLPHGSAKDGSSSEQPIWLTSSDERPNQADVLFLLDGMRSAKLAEYQRVCEIFSDDETALSSARERWQHYTTAGYQLIYWQQTDQGWKKREAIGSSDSP